MTDEHSTDEIRRVLHDEFREQRRENSRWDFKKFVSPDSLARFGMYAGSLIIAGAVIYVNTQRDISDNAKSIQRDRIAQEETNRRLSERITAERAERMEQIRQSESRLSEKIDDVLSEVKEQRNDIKSLIRALPRSDQ